MYRLCQRNARYCRERPCQDVVMLRVRMTKEYDTVAKIRHDSAVSLVRPSAASSVRKRLAGEPGVSPTQASLIATDGAGMATRGPGTAMDSAGTATSRS